MLLKEAKHYCANDSCDFVGFTEHDVFLHDCGLSPRRFIKIRGPFVEDDVGLDGHRLVEESDYDKV